MPLTVTSRAVQSVHNRNHRCTRGLPAWFVSGWSTSPRPAIPGCVGCEAQRALRVAYVRGEGAEGKARCQAARLQPEREVVVVRVARQLARQHHAQQQAVQAVLLQRGGGGQRVQPGPPVLERLRVRGDGAGDGVLERYGGLGNGRLGVWRVGTYGRVRSTESEDEGGASPLTACMVCGL